MADHTAAEKACTHWITGHQNLQFACFAGKYSSVLKYETQKGSSKAMEGTAYFYIQSYFIKMRYVKMSVMHLIVRLLQVHLASEMNIIHL